MPVKIKVTSNPNIFYSLPGNREINWGHVYKLVKAMEEKDYLSSAHPILVNENFEIIDGRHRLEALKMLNRPIYYIQGQNLKLEDVQMLNAFSKNWTPHDFALSYAKLGHVNYVVYLDLISKFKLNTGNKTLKLKHEALLLYITHSKQAQNDAFKKGGLAMPDEKKTRYMLTQLIDVASCIPDDTRVMGKIFSLAFYDLCNHPDYNHKHMVAKMRKYSDKLGKYVTVQDCLRELESIYNRFTPQDAQLRAF